MWFYSRKNKNPRFFSLLVIFFLAIAGFTSACAGASKSDVKLAPLDQMPLEVQNSPQTVRESYQFAVANPEILKQVPCYCGCGSMGHTSNYACYVSGVNAAGEIAFDNHALGCSICVDITQDVMRMLEQGKEIASIQMTIDDTYSKFGPSNIP